VFDSYFFGYVRGAYSGAGDGAKGVLVEHSDGAVFLDEIGDLPLELQPKLLRFLESGEIQPVGSPRVAHARVLVIGATNRPLADMVARGTFRGDLLARLSQVVIPLRPLRERREDIFAIARAWAHRRGNPLDASGVESQAVERLLLHEWDFNVRELFSKLDEILLLGPPGALQEWAVARVLGAPPASQAPLTQERAHQVLEQHKGNESAASRVLGVSRARLRRLLGKS
jgi:transcriptional regulator with PAS, ATPase and Fis domain